MTEDQLERALKVKRSIKDVAYQLRVLDDIKGFVSFVRAIEDGLVWEGDDKLFIEVKEMIKRDKENEILLLKKQLEDI